MKKLFLISTVAFWTVIAALGVTNLLEPDTPAPVAPRESIFTLEQVARHASEQDCWMAIGASVYDLTAYLPLHPSDPAIVLPWCGREATIAYHTKTSGRPHSPRADALLPKYRIGSLAPAR